MENLIIETVQAIAEFVRGGVWNVGTIIFSVMFGLLVGELRRVYRK